MRIGIDATSCGNVRGYGRFTREVLRALAPIASGHELVCFFDRRSSDAFPLAAPNLTRVVVPQRVSPSVAASSEGARSPSDLLRMTRAVWARQLDVFFAPTVYTYFPLPPRLRALVTIHDVIAERFPHLTLPSRRARLFWRAKVALGRLQARLILTVSDFSAHELEEVLGVAADRIRVALEAPSADYAPSRSQDDIDDVIRRIGLPPGSRWLLYVGGLNPHKLVETIIDAHAQLMRRTHHPPPYLVLAGPTDRDVFLTDRSALADAVARHGSPDHIRWTGFVPDEDLRHLYSGALALVLVSTCEGFGLPAIEAAACGTPSIATTASPLPQLLEGGGLFVNPGDVTRIADAMSSVVSDAALRRRLGETARGRVAPLSWDRCARTVLSALEEAAA